MDRINQPTIFPPKEVTSSQDWAHALRERLVALELISSGWFRRIPHPNGKDTKITLQQVWEMYEKDHLPTITESARVLKTFRCVRFLPPLFPVRMCELSPQVISEFIRFMVERAKAKPHSQRWNHEKELRDLRSLCNWYKDTIDFQFANPIKQHHYKLAVIREIPRRNRQISVEQFQHFLSHLPEFARDLALLQFFSASRVGETAGIQWKNVNFDKKILTIQEVLVWIRGKGAVVKNTPKNGCARSVFLNETMIEILNRRALVRDGSEFVFHREGVPLPYSLINSNFNRAWKKSGLTQFRGTHQGRYAAAQLARRLTGSIDGVKSVTGHQDLHLAQKYSDFDNIDQNRSSVEMMETALLAAKKHG